MPEVTDDFGRVGNFKSADFDSLAGALKSAVGKAVDYAAGRSKTAGDEMQKEFDRLVDAMEELGDDIKDNLKEVKGFVDEVKKASESMSKRRETKAEGSSGDLASEQSEQTRILGMILKNQQKATDAKTAKFTSGSTSLSAPSPRGKSMKDVGFSPKGADKIPAMLSPGEFIVSKAGTEGNESMLNKVNRGYFKGGKVKPKYLSGGSGSGGSGGLPVGGRGNPEDISQRIHLIVDGTADEEERKRLQELFAGYGHDVEVKFSEEFNKGLKQTSARWMTSLTGAFLGSDPFAKLFEGGVKDITDFRREMRILAFQTEGITGEFRDSQAEFAKIGTNISGRTGKSVTAFQEAYMANNRKGFKDQKAGMKVLESGLKLSTLIGSESQATAELFADFHRELGMGAVEMERMANSMQHVARRTGVTGDELVGVMKSSEQILKNLRKQGNLTTAAAKNVVSVMAEMKKDGFEEEGQRMLTAMSGFSGFKAADAGTQSMLGIGAQRGLGNGGYQELMFGNIEQDSEKLGKVAKGMKEFIADSLNIDPKNFDFDMITEDQRRQLSIIAEAQNTTIGAMESGIKALTKQASGLGGELGDLQKIKSSKTAGQDKKAEAEKKMNDVLLSSSMDLLQSVQQATDKFGDKTIAEIGQVLGEDNKFGRDFATGTNDLAAMASYMSSSTKGQFGLSGTQDQMAEQIKALGSNEQMQLRQVVAAEQLDKTMVDQGKGSKNFAGQIKSAFGKGDTAKIKDLSAEMGAAFSEVQIQDSGGVDPYEELNLTMVKLNDTIRSTISPLLGGIVDLIGGMGLLAITFGSMGASLFNMVPWDIVGRIADPDDGILNMLSRTFSSRNDFFRPFFAGMARGRRYAASEGIGELGPLTGLMRGLNMQLTEMFGSTFTRVLGPAVLLLGGIKGVMEATEANRTKTEGFFLGALTGGAKTGSFASSTLGVQKGSATDKTLGVAGAAAWGAMAGAAISVSLGGMDFGASILIGAIIGGVMEIVKIITDGTDILQDILKPFQVVVDYVYEVCKDIYDFIAAIFTLDLGRAAGAIFNLVGSTIALIPRLIMSAFQSILIGLPKLIFKTLGMIWDIPRAIMDSIKSTLAGLVDNAWVGPIFKVLSDAFNSIYDGFMEIWTPISAIFSGLYTVFSDLGKALFGASEGGGLLSGLMWVLQKAVWSLAYVISWVISPIKLLASALGFILKIVGALIQGIIAPFQYLYDTLVGNSIVPDLVFGIIKFFAMLPIRIMKFLAMIPIHLAKALLNLHVMIGSAIMSIGSAIMAGFKAVFVDLPAYLWNGLTSLASNDWFAPIFEPLMWVLSPLKDAMSALYESFAEVGSAFAEVGSVFGELYGVVSEVLDSLYDAVSSVFGALYDAVSSVLSSVYAVFAPVASIFGGTGEAASEAFGFMDVLKGAIWGLSKSIGFVLKVALFPLKLILEGLAAVIKFVANVIKGFAEIIAGVFTLDGAKIWKGISGIGAAFASAFLWIPKMLFGMFKKIPKILFNGLKAAFFDFPSWLMGKIVDGAWAVGNFFVVTLPKLMWQAFKNSIAAVGKFVLDTLIFPFRKIWEFMSWALESVKQKAMEAWEYIKSLFDLDAWASWVSGLGPQVYEGLTSSLQGVWDWIKSWIPGLGTVSKAAGAVGKTAGAAWEGAKSVGSNALEGLKAAGSYLNPFSYFEGYKRGTKKIERSGLAMLHEGEMVVPKNILDKMSAMGNGAFGSIKSFVGGKIGGGEGGEGGMMGALKDKFQGFGDMFKNCCPKESVEGAGSAMSEIPNAISEALGKVDDGSFLGDIKKRLSVATGYTNKFFKPMTIGFVRARKRGEGFFKAITKGFKSQYMSMTEGGTAGVAGRLSSGLGWLEDSIFGSEEGGKTKKGILSIIKDGVFGSNDGTKQGIFDVLKDGVFGKDGAGAGVIGYMKDKLFGNKTAEGEMGPEKPGLLDMVKGKAMDLYGQGKERLFGQQMPEGEMGPGAPGLLDKVKGKVMDMYGDLEEGLLDKAKGKAMGLYGMAKGKLFGHKTAAGEMGPEKPGLLDVAKIRAMDMYGKGKERLFGQQMPEGEMGPGAPGLIDKAKSRAMDMYGKGKEKLFGEKMAEGEMGPAKPGLIDKAKSRAMDMYGKGKEKLFGEGPAKALKSAGAADAKASGKMDGFKDKMMNIAEGIKKFSGTQVLAGALNLIPSSIGLVAMIPGSYGAKMMEKIDGERLSTSLTGLGKGVASLGTKKVLLGAVAMAVVGVASLGLIPAIPMFAMLGLVGPMAQTGLKALGKGLSAFGKAAMNPYTWLGVLLLGALNVVMIPLGYALGLAAPAIQAFGSAIKSAFEGAGSLLKAVGESIGMILKEITISKALALGVAAAGIGALGVAMVAFAAGGAAASWIGYFGGDGVFTQIMGLAAMGPNLMMAANAINILGAAFQSFAANKGGGWSEWFSGSDGVIEGFKRLSEVGTPQFVATADAIHKVADGLEKMQGMNAVATAEGVPSSAPAAGVEPVHLQDITGSILREKAGSGGSKLQSDELSRMEETAYKQVTELEQIREGINALVSLMRPRGSVAGASDESGPGQTKDPRRPLHAARFGKMKYGGVGGLANRSFVNNGEV